MRKLLFVFFVTLSGLSALAQSGELSPKKQRKVDQLFFEAMRYKVSGKPQLADSLFSRAHKIDPSNFTISMEISRFALQNKNLERALAYTAKAEKYAPENEEVLKFSAGVYRAAGETDEEERVYKTLAKIAPENPNYPFALAQVKKQQKEYKDALKILDEIEETYGATEYLLREKQDVYLKLGEVDKAAEQVRKLIELNPRNVEYYGILAALYEANGYRAEAKKVYFDLLYNWPNEARGYLNLAEIYRSEGNVDSMSYNMVQACQADGLTLQQKIQMGVSLLQGARTNPELLVTAVEIADILERTYPEEYKVFALKGEVLLAQGNFAASRTYFKKAVTQKGDIYQMWLQILSLDIQTEAWDSLVVDATLATESFPNSPEAYFYLGIGQMQLENHKQAVNAFEESLSLLTNQTALEEQVYANLGEAYHNLKDFQKSDRAFDKALSINPNSVNVLNNYAYYLSLRKEKLDKAAQMAERCNQLSPKSAIYLDTWGWVLFQQGNYEKALEKMELAILYGGDKMGEVVEHLGDIYQALDNPQKAVLYWKKAKELGGTSENIDQKIEGK